MRKLLLAGLMALALMAVGASVASAQTGVDSTTGVPLPVGTMYNAVNSTHVTFTGVPGGPVTCTQAQFQGTVTANPPFTATIDFFSITGCTDATGAPCTVTVRGLPWNPPAAGLLASGVPGAWNMSIGMGPGGYIDVTCGGVTCSYTGAGAGPGGLVNSITGPFTNPPVNNDLSFNAAPLNGIATPTGKNCGPAAIDAMFIIRIGTVPGAGNQIALI